MYNWSTDTTSVAKSKDKFAIYSLEQAINFGLNGTKLSLTELRKYWEDLSIDSDKKSYLSKLVWRTS